MLNTLERIRERTKYWSLYVKLQKYEDKYFKDMTFQDKRLQNKLMKVKIKMGEKWVDCVEVAFYSLLDWVVVYADDQNKLEENIDGKCLGEEKKIIIRKFGDLKKERNILLHEMIHAYESILPEARKQYLVLYLYKKLLKKIGRRKLEKLLDLGSHAHLMMVLHTPLFMLKSLDLDLRLKQPLGTIYGRGDLFKEAIMNYARRSKSGRVCKEKVWL